MSRYGVEVRIICPVFDLSSEDVLSQAEATRLLGVRQQTLLVQLNDGRFSTVWRLRLVSRTARYLLRAEVEDAVAGDRSPGGRVTRRAPELWDGVVPDVAGCDYGLEARVVRPAPEIGAGDVISQTAAAEILGIHRSTLSRAMNRRRFTVVWDLEREGEGRASARCLLRSEVLEAAGGGRAMSRLSYKVPPGVEAPVSA